MLRKRQELLPYLYSLCARAHFDGRALLEPIYYEYPYDEEAYNAPQEYFFGDLLVAPVTERTDAQTGLAMREIWLPEGDWLELSSDLIYRGGRYIRLFRYLEEIPVFMPKGCIFVTGTENLLNVTVFGADAEYELYEDDGETTDYQDGIFNDTKFSVHREGNTIEMLVASGKHTELLPKTRTYRFLFRSISRAVVSAQIGETECEVQTEKKEDGLLIQVTDADSDAEIRIILRDIQDISDGERMKKRALKMFGRLNGNNVKIMEWFHVFDSDFDGSDITKFLEMGMPPRFADALSELKQAGS